MPTPWLLRGQVNSWQYGCLHEGLQPLPHVLWIDCNKSRITWIMRVDIISYHVHCHRCICLCTPVLLDQEDWFIYLHAFPSCISIYDFNSVGVLLLVSSLQVPPLATPCYTCSSHCNTINCCYSYTKKWSVYSRNSSLYIFFPLTQPLVILQSWMHCPHCDITCSGS